MVVPSQLPSYGVRREPTGVQKFTRSNTIESFKLPGVGVGSVYAQIAKKKQPLPVKTFHLKLHPEHTSLMSKSMSSLPSIPGSPSQSHSPSSDYKAFPSTHGKHRYQKISFQKRIHSEKDISVSPTSKKEDGSAKKDKPVESVYNNVLPHSHRSLRHRLSVSEPDSDRYDDSNSLKSFNRSRRARRLSRDSSISDTRSEGGVISNKKWKDDCGCLRCQMLKRQYKEGDDMYNKWGQYPCHRVDFGVRLDDD